MDDGPGLAPSFTNLVQKFLWRGTGRFRDSPLGTVAQHIGVEHDDGLLLGRKPALCRRSAPVPSEEHNARIEYADRQQETHGAVWNAGRGQADHHAADDGSSLRRQGTDRFGKSYPYGFPAFSNALYDSELVVGAVVDEQPIPFEPH